jgi:cellulose biosynthesis protein BcsQ
MQIHAISGKGGVGKSTVSAALAMALAYQNKKTLLIDCDKGGKAIARTLSPEGKINLVPNNFFCLGIPNLIGGAVSSYNFTSLPRADSPDAMQMASEGISRESQFQKYISQFPEDYGFVAFNDMMSTFFGVNANPDQAADFVTLSKLILPAIRDDFDHLILDLEPTKGTSRLLKNIDNAARTLESMSKYGFLTLKMISAKFPDIRRFLDSPYFAKTEVYSERLREAAHAVSQADYLLVCGPESAKVQEMLDDTQPIVESYNGVIRGYAINDIRHLEGREAESQKHQIAAVKKAGKAKSLPVIELAHNPLLAIDGASDHERQRELRKTGLKLLENLAVV